MRESQNKLFLTVADNGIGMTDEQQASLGSSFGYKLIKALVGQLQGGHSIDKSEGTSVNIILGRYDKT